MTVVRITANWSEPNILRQTPGCSGVWNDIQFTRDPVDEPDYVVAINCANPGEVAKCDPERMWVLLMEPPEGEWPAFHKGNPELRRIYTTDSKLTGPKYRHTHPALPWHVNRTYDQLRNEQIPEKPLGLSWVVSSKARYGGHKARLDFLEQLNGRVDFHLFGQGFNPIQDKWDGLAPYKYSLAVENHRNRWYWTEKISDCFLAWTMPIYCGCTDIARFFPRESFIEIDVTSPDAIERVQEAVNGDLWKRNLDAIAYARELVLNKYQFFAMMTSEIAAYESATGAFQMTRERIDLRELTQPRETLVSRITAKLKPAVGKQ